jgi:hypothetical protein
MTEPTERAFRCHWCNKGYQRRENLNKHELLCEVSYKKGNTANISLPSTAQLFTMVTELTKRCQQLESRVEDLEQGRKKRKVKDILTELNDESREKPTISVDHFIDTEIQVHNDHVSLLLEKRNSYADCFDEIIKSIHFCDNSPMQMLSNKVYIFQNDRYDEWTKEFSLLFFERIKRKILLALMAWKAINGGDQVDRDETLGLQYNNALLKVMKTDFTSDSFLAQKLRSKMYAYKQ